MQPFHNTIQPFSAEISQDIREKAFARKTDPVYGELFLVFSGMGPPRYLTESGTVYVEGDLQDLNDQKTRPACLSETLSCLCYTADRLDIPAIRSLLPKKATDATECQRCENSNGWVRMDGPDGESNQILCWECKGLGWLPAVPWDG